jgi:BirA family transcriptional regulator, biotin operon repressor / biotin---[acetyl-CoA-carboxylase] ligase
MQFTIHRYESVVSTNDIALRLANKGAPEGTVVVSREQSAGRGRQGRGWSSPADAGLYLSLVLRPNHPPDELWHSAFMAAVSAAEAIEHASGLSAAIKWPNDILIGGRKVCGILIETRNATDGAGYVVAGIGVNVNTRCFPPELVGCATSIALELGKDVPVLNMEEALLQALDRRYEDYLQQGFPQLLEAWKRLDCTVGRTVVVHAGGSTIQGTAAAVDSSGDLMVQVADGRLIRVVAGEVLFS